MAWHQLAPTPPEQLGPQPALMLVCIQLLVVPVCPCSQHKIVVGTHRLAATLWRSAMIARKLCEAPVQDASPANIHCVCRAACNSRAGRRCISANCIIRVTNIGLSCSCLSSPALDGRLDCGRRHRASLRGPRLFTRSGGAGERGDMRGLALDSFCLEGESPGCAPNETAVAPSFASDGRGLFLALQPLSIH